MTTAELEKSCFNTKELMEITIDEIESFRVLIPTEAISIPCRNRKIYFTELIKDDFIKAQFTSRYTEGYIREVADNLHILLKENYEYTLDEIITEILLEVVPIAFNSYSSIWNIFNFDMVKGIVYKGEVYTLTNYDETYCSDVETYDFIFMNAKNEVSLKIKDMAELFDNKELEFIFKKAE